MLRPNEVASPHYLYRNNRINAEIIKNILVDLSIKSGLSGTYG